MDIKIFLTGGTFDKEYNEITGKLYFKETHLLEMLRLGRNRVPVSTETLMMIDSLEMADADRTLIIQSIKDAKEDQILVTHGTDTMVESAKVIAEKVQHKTIVLVGAMIPYKFGSSDGLLT